MPKPQSGQVKLEKTKVAVRWSKTQECTAVKISGRYLGVTELCCVVSMF